MLSIDVGLHSARAYVVAIGLLARQHAGRAGQLDRHAQELQTGSAHAAFRMRQTSLCR
ncbi:hypothetical protein [Mesorhizobium sp.]|uniref:hypothetical protein n=1 Tax=Mesorhizobium sp. TaxID=1871066 RepID=UPI0025FCA581|nr:hypothetical protein [Mesorhizobium sp.]